MKQQRVRTYIKETYEQVGEYEFNMVNPYVQAIGHLRCDHPNAVVTKTQTVTEWVECEDDRMRQMPILIVRYEI